MSDLQEDSVHSATKGKDMNIAIIFAGGTGQRMNTKTTPKQFLKLHGKAIIIHTIERFEMHPEIDKVVVVCLEPWIPTLERMVQQNGFTKVASIVPGGDSGQASIRNGVYEAARLFPGDSIVLIHDGVRPLLSEETITACIESVKEHGSAITCVPATETIVQEKDGKIFSMIERQSCRLARAPQCFYLDDIRHAHEQAVEDGREDFIDSAYLMSHYGHDLYVVEGGSENIKITTPPDFYIFRAIIDAQENSQILGL